MNREKAQEHLARVAGLRVQCPNRAQDHPHYWHDGPNLLSVTSGICSPYRVTSSFAVHPMGNWIIWQIRHTIRLKIALAKAAMAHPLYPKEAI